MKPRGFEYLVPGTLDEAVAMLAESGEMAKVLAGGQSLLPVMSLGLAEPETIVDLNRVDELVGISLVGDAVRIGAMTRQRAVERSEVVAAHLPIVVAALGNVAHFQIRNRGTFGGNVAHADGASELPAVLLALEARIVAASRERSARTIAARDFFLGHYTTALEPDELLVAVEIPVMGPGLGWGFHELARRHGDFALAGAAALIGVEGGRIASAVVSLFGVAGAAIRSAAAEESLLGAVAEGSAAEGIDQLVGEAVEPFGDIHGSAEYRRRMAGVVAQRAVREAIDRAGGS